MMKQVCDNDMIAQAVGDDAELARMKRPPFTEATVDHPLWLAVEAAICEVYDPEIPVNIYELGLIYKVDIQSDNNIYVEMTLTSPGCPVAGEMPGMVENAIKTVDAVGEVKVEIVWDPTWDPSKMAETAKLQLNMF